MNRSSADPAGPAAKQRSGLDRLRCEALYVAILLAFGVFVLPALIYGVGTTLLGPYVARGGIEAGWQQFYGDFFMDLASPSLRAWAIAAGPLLLITLIRMLFIGLKRRAAPTAGAPRSSGGRPRSSPPASPQAAPAGAMARRDPQLAGAPAQSKEPAEADEIITAGPRRGGAGPRRPPGRIEPRIGPG